MSDIKRARELLDETVPLLKEFAEAFADAAIALGKLIEARSLMTRRYTKTVVRRGIKVTDEHRRRVIQLYESGTDTQTCAEIAEAVFGNPCASGRVSEIIKRHVDLQVAA